MVISMNVFLFSNHAMLQFYVCTCNIDSRDMWGAARALFLICWKSN